MTKLSECKTKQGIFREVQTKVFVVDYSDFDEFIKSHYNKECFNCVAELEIGNDSCHIFDMIDGKSNKWDRNELKKFKTKSESDYSTPRILLNDLCKQKIIEPGMYIIHVCW